jgi:hypothetical protein
MIGKPVYGSIGLFIGKGSNIAKFCQVHHGLVTKLPKKLQILFQIQGLSNKELSP